MDQRAQKLLRLVFQPAGHRRRFLGRQAFQLVKELQFEAFFLRIFLNLGALARDLRLIHLTLRLRGEIRAGAHRERAGQRAGQPRREHHLAAARVARHAGDDAEDGAEAVVDAVDGVADPPVAADVPAFAPQDRVEGRARRRDRAAGQRAQHDGVVAFFEHRVFGDPAIGGIAQLGHQLVVFRLRPAFLLLEAVEHDVGIADALKPGEAAFHFLAIRLASGRQRDAFRPPGGVFFLLLGEADQDVAALRIALAVGQ